jgi:hypothetical protein
MTPDDDNLEVRMMRFVDGAMSAAERESFLEEMEREPGWPKRLDTYLFTERVVDAFDRITRGPAPADLVATIMQTGRSAPAAPPIKPFMYSRALFERLAEKYRAPMWSLAGAAALSLAVVAAAGWYALPHPGPFVLNESGLVAVAPLRHALESIPSGGAYRSVGWHTAAFRPFATYRSQEGDWCRLYEVQYGENAARGLACRTGEGAWQIRSQLPLTGIVLAGPQQEAANRKFGADIKRITTDKRLSQQEEDEALRGGWRTDR